MRMRMSIMSSIDIEAIRTVFNIFFHEEILSI